MSFSIAQRNAAFGAVKVQLMAMIDENAGFFAGSIKSKITNAEILVISNAALDGAAKIQETKP